MWGRVQYSISAILLAYFLVVTVALFMDAISFGAGLGDLGMLLILACFTIFSWVLYWLSVKVPKMMVVFVVLNLATVVYSLTYFTLCLTIWRGSEMPWDGQVFI